MDFLKTKNPELEDKILRNILRLVTDKILTPEMLQTQFFAILFFAQKIIAATFPAGVTQRKLISKLSKPDVLFFACGRLEQDRIRCSYLISRETTVVAMV